MKKKLCLTIAIVMLILVSAFSCFAETSETRSVKTGIIGAMDEEVSSLKEAMTEENIKTIAGMELERGTSRSGSNTGYPCL